MDSTETSIRILQGVCREAIGNYIGIPQGVYMEIHGNPTGILQGFLKILNSIGKSAKKR